MLEVRPQIGGDYTASQGAYSCQMIIRYDNGTDPAAKVLHPPRSDRHAYYVQMDVDSGIASRIHNSVMLNRPLGGRSYSHYKRSSRGAYWKTPKWIASLIGTGARQTPDPKWGLSIPASLIRQMRPDAETFISQSEGH